LNLQSILWFDPRREHSFVPTARSHAVARRACQGWPRLSRPPEGLGLDWPEHGGILDRIETAGARHIVGKFKPVVLRQIHAAGDTLSTRTIWCFSDGPVIAAGRDMPLVR
jgi:hypothetical protein